MILWKSRKVRRVVKSTIAAETLALLDAAEAAVLFSYVVAEMLNLKEKRPIVNCYVDNKSLVEAVYSTKLGEDKLLRINMVVLRDIMNRKEIHRISLLESSCQLADGLTKRGANMETLVSAVGR